MEIERQQFRNSKDGQRSLMLFSKREKIPYLYSALLVPPNHLHNHYIQSIPRHFPGHCLN
jgi:hypothetical protein